MTAIKPSKNASDFEKQLDAVLESVTEISISTEKDASQWVISFKCLWMSGNTNQEAMQAERTAMTNYAICKQRTGQFGFIFPSKNACHVVGSVIT